MIISLWVLIYLSVGLAIYFTFPNRKNLPIGITLPFIVAWFVIAIMFLVKQPKQK